jgi:raffinose/stachyose/melibiose transport system permease protein
VGNIMSEDASQLVVRPEVSQHVAGKTHRPLRSLKLLALLGPSFILIVLFSYYPAFRSIMGDFTQWNGFGAAKFVGLSNFTTYVNSFGFGDQLRNVLILIVGSIAISVIAQFSAAEIVAHLKGRSQSIIKYALALPIVLPVIVLIDIWAYLLTPQGGVIDTVLQGLGLSPIDWLGSPRTALISILLIGFPWIANLGFLIFLAGIQRLPSEVNEAASLDGASSLRRIWSVDLPLLRPQLRVVVILSAIFAVQNFIPILLLTSGGPGNATEVPGLDMYQSAFQGDQYGFAMAIGTMMFITMLIITLVVNKALKPKV